MKTDSGIMNISGKNTNLKHKLHFKGENTMENRYRITEELINIYADENTRINQERAEKKIQCFSSIAG